MRTRLTSHTTTPAHLDDTGSTSPVKRLSRLALWIASGLLLLVLGVLVGFSERYSPEYVRRVVLWQEADTQDYLRFPERPVEASAAPFTFATPADPAAAAAQVQAAFASDSLVGGDLDGFLASTGTRAFIVIQDDTILYEKYFNGAARDSIATSFSTAKSFVSALAGIAIDEGHIASVDDPITDYLPELLARDPRFARITIRDLLNMASGIKYVENSFITGDDALTYYHPDMRSLALEETAIAGEPGTTWLYNNYHPLLLGLILERATGQHVATYLQEKLWKPLGMEFPASWSLDSEATGFEKMESGINARPIDYAKLGRLYLNGGAWEGQQVVPAAWVDASTRMDTTVDRAGYYPPSFEQPFGHVYHQRLWWGVQQDDGDYGFYAHGNHGQFIFVWPRKNLIIVRMGERYGIDPLDWVSLFTHASERIGAGP
jgi:CubicO group peptidase (beta-lactamase class C family)